jgi:iron complex outermembrane receptor protein
VGKKAEPVTLRIERDGRELWRSSASGLRPLVEAVLTLGEGLRGASAYDKVVGLASAKLLVYAGVAEARADVASAPAVRFAERVGLLLGAVVVTPRILNRERTGLCPMEVLALEEESPEAFFRAVAQRLGFGEGGAHGTGKVG